MTSRNIEISVDIREDSPFLLLPSPLVQREVLQKIYKSISCQNSLSYDSTCQILSLINEKTAFGKRAKVLHLCKDVSAVKIGDYLVFKLKKETIADSVNSEHRSVTITEDDMLDNETSPSVLRVRSNESEVLLCVAGISIKHSKV